MLNTCSRAWQVGILASMLSPGVWWARSFPKTMSTEFLSLKDAEAFTGKSRSTLRRFVEAITRTENHLDRHLIEPSIDEVQQLHAANNPFAWRINRDLLEREFRKQGIEAGKPAGESPSGASPELVKLLQQSIDMLREELVEKNKQIGQFQERQRESNLLIQQANERLTFLTAPRTEPKEVSQTKPTKEVTADVRKEKTPKKKARRSFWQLLTTPL